MRSYSKISHALWQSERFNDLPSDDARYAYLYFLTSSHQTSAGSYRLPVGYACADLRWPPERYANARKQLVDADMLAFDGECNVIFIRRWFKHNPPMNNSHLKSIEGELSRLPSKAIAQAASIELEEFQDAIEAEKLAKLARKQPQDQNAPGDRVAAMPQRLNTGYLNKR